MPTALAARTARHLLAAALAAAAVAQAPIPHDQLWSDEFALPGVGAPVHALLPMGDQLIVGGEFQQLRGHVTGHIGRWDGAAWTPMAQGLPDTVRALALHQGSLHAGGDFGVARWTGSAWQPLPGLTLYSSTPSVHALCSHQGELWAGGEFDQAGALTVHGLARWNGTAWQAPPGGGAQHALQEPRVLALLSSPSGRLFVGGEFQQLGGVAAANVAEYSGQWRGLGSGTDRTVRALLEFQGSLHVGGDFAHAGGLVAAGLARWTGTGYQPLGSGLSGPSGFVQVFALGSFHNALHAGGTFDSAGGAPAAAIASWDGGRWSPLAAGLQHTPGFQACPQALAEWRGLLHVGGDFARCGSGQQPGQAIVSHHLAAWNGSAWSGVGSGLGTDSDVLAITGWNGGTVVGGRFPLAGGQYAPGLAWLRGGEFRFLGAFDGPVLDACVYRGDLVVTGQFRMVGNVAANQIARYDGSRWWPIGVGAGEYCVAVYQDQLYAGGIGAPRRWTGTTWQTFGTAFGGAVTAMVVHQGALYLGGNFAGAGAPPNLARWDGTAMTAVGGGVNGYGVGALASFGSDLVVGGTFSLAGGAPAANLAAFDGASFRALGGGVPGSSVNALAVLGNQLWVGGDLGNWPGAAERRYVAVWDGAQWTLPGRGPAGAVLALYADPVRQQVFAGGWFYTCSGRPAWNLCRYDAQPACQDLGYGSRGAVDRPELRGSGVLRAPGSLQLSLHGAPPSTVGLHVAGLQRAMLPLFDGVLVPQPAAQSLLFTDASGGASLTLPLSWPLPPGRELLWQCLLLDGRVAGGVQLSNAVRQTSR